MCCGSHQKIPFEAFKVFLIFDNDILRNFSLDTLLEVHEVLCIGIGVWFGWSSVSNRGYCPMAQGRVVEPPGHELLPGDLPKVLWK